MQWERSLATSKKMRKRIINVYLVKQLLMLLIWFKDVVNSCDMVATVAVHTLLAVGPLARKVDVSQ